MTKDIKNTRHWKFVANLVEKLSQSCEYYHTKDGFTLCTISYMNIDTYGESNVAPEDVDFMNEYAGNEIARIRAIMKYLKIYIKLELHPKEMALKNVVDVIDNVDKNENSMAKKKLLSHYNLYKNRSKATRIMIHNLDNYLTNYISKKEEVYKKIRKNRKLNEAAKATE